MYLLQLYFDHFEPEACNASTSLLAQHSIIYVDEGEVRLNDTTTVAASEAAYVEDYAKIQAGASGAILWRWVVINRAEHTLTPMEGQGIRSTLRMSRQVKMFEMVPTSKWLFKLDCIMGFSGSTGLHSHPGSGIRCLLSGHLRTESTMGENTDNRGHGATWYEEGAYPLTSTVEEGTKTTFLRGMILPVEFSEFGDTAWFIEKKLDPDNNPINEGWKGLKLQNIVLR